MFLVGDRVRNTMRESDGVVVVVNSDDRVHVNYGKGRGPEPASVSNLILLRKGTDVQQALRNDPEALMLFAEHFKVSGRIEITCQTSKAEKLAGELSSVSCLTACDACDYIRLVTEASHAAKFDILVSVEMPAGLADRLGVYFHLDGLRAHEGEAQVNSRPLAEWLMKVHNVLPKKWA